MPTPFGACPQASSSYKNLSLMRSKPMEQHHTISMHLWVFEVDVNHNETKKKCYMTLMVNICHEWFFLIQNFGLLVYWFIFFLSFFSTLANIHNRDQPEFPTCNTKGSS